MAGTSRGRALAAVALSLSLGAVAGTALAKPKQAAAEKKADKQEPASKKAEKKPDAKADPKRSDEKPEIGPGEGQGDRKVVVEKKSEPPKKAETSSKAAKEPEKPKPEPEAKPAGPAHQKGRPPKKPSPTLPKGTAKSTPNDAARRAVAGGATAEQVARGTNDPELSALRDADRVLFPKPLSGARSGFDWDLPEQKKQGPDVVASGLPPDARLRATPSVDAEEVASDAEWLKSLTMPNLPVRLEARVVRYLKFYRDSARGKAIARVWAKKSGRYVPALKAELAKAGLPTDLVWLSLIESGHNPTIVSPAGAGGLWQFMPESGRLYGLTVDRWVDERMDPARSTEAAIRYLSDLHRRFGNWELAMAAYNMGYGGLSGAIKKFNTNDFWELCRYEAGIPWETTLYVPKIFAIAIVMNNKKAFGISGVTPDAPESFDTVLVDPGTSFDQIALAAELPTRTIEGLNPHYLASRVPPARPGQKSSSWRVRVPSGKGVATSQRMHKVWASDSKVEPYVVRFGDTLSSIAGSRSVGEAALAKINKLGRDESLAAGTVLLVPQNAEREAPDSEDDVVVVPPRNFSYPDKKRVFYRVRPGDTLGQIAHAFGVARSELEAWNSLDPSARLQPKMTLQLFVPKSASLSGVRFIPDTDARVLVAGSDEFFDYHEGQKGKKRLIVEVKAGETLASIGRRYGMSVGWMERVNRCSRSKKLRPGEKLVVYAPKSMPDPIARADEPATEPLPAVVAPRPEALPPVDEGSPSAEASTATDTSGS